MPLNNTRPSSNIIRKADTALKESAVCLNMRNVRIGGSSTICKPNLSASLESSSEDGGCALSSERLRSSLDVDVVDLGLKMSSS